MKGHFWKVALLLGGIGLVAALPAHADYELVYSRPEAESLSGDGGYSTTNGCGSISHSGSSWFGSDEDSISCNIVFKYRNTGYNILSSGSCVVDTTGSVGGNAAMSDCAMGASDSSISALVSGSCLAYSNFNSVGNGSYEQHATGTLGTPDGIVVIFRSAVSAHSKTQTYPNASSTAIFYSTVTAASPRRVPNPPPPPPDDPNIV